MRAAQLFIAALAACMLAGCGGGDTAAPSSSASLATALAANRGQPGKTVVVTLPATTDAVAGRPIQLVAKVTDNAGKPVSGTVLTWASADLSIATVGQTGLLSPLRPGSVKVTASGGGSTGVTAVTVRDASTGVRSKYVGTNLAGVGYWASQFPFADMMKGATPWAPREDSGAQNTAFPAMTPDGYPASLNPGQHAVSTVASDSSRYPAGRYVVLWDGEGTLGFPADIVTVFERSAGRVAIDVKSGPGALWLSIDSTSAANPLRNLRFLWPGTESTYVAEPFNKEFLTKIQPFSSLRFMDWGAINGSPVVNWADRALVSDLTYQSSKGVPIEVMIDLANKLHVDPWFCIPHQASDDYVRNFAALLHGRLDATLKPHIEYSNEVWNTGFAQTNWAIAESKRLGLQRTEETGPPSRFYAQRSVEMFKIIQQVYGAADSGRLVRVIAGQAAGTQFLKEALAWNGTAANADVMAIAPYFSAEAAGNPANVDATLRLTSEQIVDQMFANVRGPVTKWIGDNALIAGEYRLKMKGYEGGQHNYADYFPADKAAAMTALFIAANRSPRMRDLYLEYYGLWTANGGDTMNHYNDMGTWKLWGMWGALEYVTQDPATSPKHRGLLDFIAAHPTP